MSGHYDPALASVHASGYASTYASGFDWLVAEILSASPTPRLFDIGCGDGTWLAHAVRSGLPASGADISPAFVSLARARGLSVTCASALDAPIPRLTTAITAMGEVLSYLDPSTSAPSLPSFLTLAASALPPSGLLLADLIGPSTPARSGVTRGPGWHMTSTTAISGGTLTRTMQITNDTGTHTVTHRQAVLDPDEVLALAISAGFTARLLSSYGPARLLPGRLLLKAQMP